MDTELHKVYLSYSLFTIIVQQGWPEFNCSLFYSDTPRDLPPSPVTNEPVRIVYSQASEFLQQVKQLFFWDVNVNRFNFNWKFHFQLQIFEDLLNCRKLKPDERRKVKSQIIRGTNSPPYKHTNQHVSLGTITAFWRSPFFREQLLVGKGWAQTAAERGRK